MWEALLSAGSKLVGGYFNKEAQDAANATNQANWQTSMAYQDLANKNNIQWKVADAKAAGLHPLAALGVQPAGGPVSHVGATPATGMGDAVSGMGQDISRAMRASETQQKRAESYDNAVRSLDIENKSLQNELLRSRIAKEKTGTPPPLPSFDQRWQVPGSGDTPQIKMKPFEVTPGEPGKPHMEPGAISDVGHARTAGGGYAPVPSKEMQERIEDNFLASLSWMWRNQIIPSFGGKEAPPAAAPPEGYEWRYHPLRQEYRPARRRGIWKEWL